MSEVCAVCDRTLVKPEFYYPPESRPNKPFRLDFLVLCSDHYYKALAALSRWRYKEREKVEKRRKALGNIIEASEAAGLYEPTSTSTTSNCASVRGAR